MADRISAPQPSVAAIKGHPIHPMIVAFPIVALVLAFATDIAFLSTNDPRWAEASVWLLGVGVVTAALAGIAGAVDFARIKKAREHTAGWVHALGNVTVLLMALVNWLLRLSDPVAQAIPLGILLSGASTLMLLVTGWYGGELSYRHKIGVMPTEDYARDRGNGREPLEA